MARPIIVAGATTQAGAADGPVQLHGDGPYSRTAGRVKRRSPWASLIVAKVRVDRSLSTSHIQGMTKDLSPENITRIPVVEVVAPDGRVELWAVVSVHDEAVAIVQKRVPADHVVRYAGVLLPNVKIKDRRRLWPGDAVRIEP